MPEPWYFYAPYGTASDASGNIYLADTYNHCIKKFSPLGLFISKWGNKGSENGNFIFPASIAIDSSKNVYVLDKGNHRVQKFDSSGNFLSTWGEFGPGDGQFNFPQGIGVSPSGFIYVVDTGNHRIQKFDSENNFIDKWGDFGTDESQFNSPQSVAIDSLENIFIADTGNNRIQKFDSSGNFITEWGSKGSLNGQFNSPRGIAVDSNDKVYVVDTKNYRIQKFDTSGNFISKWGSWGRGNGQFIQAESVMADNFGNIYVTDVSNSRIIRYNNTGTFMGKWTSSGIEYGQFDVPIGVAVDNFGDVYVADYNNCRVQKFTFFGKFLYRLVGKWGNEAYQCYYPSCIAIDRANNVYFADEWIEGSQSSISKYSPTGAFMRKWGSWGTGDGQFRSPSGLTVDRENYVYLVDNLNNRIQKFSSSGDFILKWGSPGNEAGQFSSPRGIAADEEGYIYVVDSGNNRVQKFDSMGNFILSWGSQGSEDGQLLSPSGISVDLSGNIFIADSGNNRIQIFTPMGEFISKWGKQGYLEGDFNAPMGIAIDSLGKIHIADTYNNRIQVFQNFSMHRMEINYEPFGVKLSWKSDPQEYYSVYYSDDQLGESNIWNLFQGNISASGAETSIIIPLPSENISYRYYKTQISERILPNYDLKFGVFSDVHYDRNNNSGADINSLNKLASAINIFNAFPVDFIIGLGDFVDGNISSTEELANLADIDATLNNFSGGNAYICIGNHDLELLTAQQICNNSQHIPAPFYTFTVKGVKCIVLQGGNIPNSYSFTRLSADIDDTTTTIPVIDNSYFEDPKVIKIRNELIIYKERTGQAFTGCIRGAYATTKSAHPANTPITYHALYTKISQGQINWLAGRLATPEPKLIFVHPRLSIGYPTDPRIPTNEMFCESSDIIRPVIEAGVNVIAVFEGHEHINKLSIVNGIRYYEISAILKPDDPEDNAFGIVQIDTTKKIISVIGFGRQFSYNVTYPQ